MNRLGTLALAVLAVLALATVSASLDSVSTDLDIQSGPSDGAAPPSGSGGPDRSGGQAADSDDSEVVTATEPADTRTAEAERQVPLWQVVVGLCLFVIGSAVALYGLTRGTDEGEEATNAGQHPMAAPAPDSVRLGRDLPPSNDVYRAWIALRDAVPVDHAGRTPAEVARAAVEAGYPAGPVTDLTETFCRVRYGECDPTVDRQRRARELAAALSLSTTDPEGEP